MEQQMLEAVNRERSAYDLPPYHLDQMLATVARAHALDMVTRGYWGHVTPEGKTYRDRLVEHGLEPYWAGENWFSGTYPAGEIVETALAWFMDDPPHRDNILHKHCTRIGIGIVEGPPGTYILVLDFASD
jgi:uncharacterized protein YkwD